MTTAYVDPNTIQNPATGAALSAAFLDATRDNGELFARMPGCIVARSATQSLTDSTTTPIQFSAADERDTDNFHDIVTNNTRMTVPTGLGGWYEVGASLTFTSNSTGNRVLSFRVGGVTTYQGFTWTGASSSGNTVAGIPIKLVPTDYVEVLGFQNSGAPLNVVIARGWLRLVALA